MKKYSLLAVFLLLMCNVSVCGQTGRILFVDTTFIEKTNLQRIHHSPIYYSGNPVLKADKKGIEYKWRPLCRSIQRWRMV